jgi:hypothetical protein
MAAAGGTDINGIPPFAKTAKDGAPLLSGSACKFKKLKACVLPGPSAPELRLPGCSHVRSCLLFPVFALVSGQWAERVPGDAGLAFVGKASGRLDFIKGQRLAR